MKPLMTLLILCLITIAFGCGTENPICSDNFCVTGEIFPKSELNPDATYDAVSVDEASVLTMFTNTQPPTHTKTPDVATDSPQTGVTLKDIVTDVGAGNKTFLNQTITVTGFVVFRTPSGNALTLHTNTSLADSAQQPAVFWIQSFGNPEALDAFPLRSRHTVTVTIYLIEPPKGTRTYYSIWTRF